MAEEVVVSVRDVTKKYRLFGSPKDRLKEALHPFRKTYHHEFWALKGVSLDIPRGQVLGVIGRNGSGKSTLLQIVAGILRPSNGTVVVNGRITALLELGAGFNREFTGRDNVILNGAVIGLSQKEMLARLPEVEAFAAIGEFFNQPVKTYSSGMFARLAFAAAINLDPDVFIIDEILAVGDIRFQNKCYLKLRELQSSGKTIILVSHDPEAIIRNCQRAILIDDGRVECEGASKEVVDRYLELLFSRATEAKPLTTQGQSPEIDSLKANYEIELHNFMRAATQGDQCRRRETYNRDEYRFGERGMEIIDYLIVANGILDPVEVESGVLVELYIKALAHETVKVPSVGISVKTVDGVMLYGINTLMQGLKLPALESGQGIVVEFSLVLNVAGGDIFLDLGCGDWSTTPQRALDRRHSIIHLRVITREVFGGLANLRCTTALKAVVSQVQQEGNIE